ncbi:DUF6868 family protein [Candidatus Omnitrophota bacterium]
MTIETMRAVLGWCSIINIGILLWWFFAITVLHDFVYKFHSKFLKLSVERFDEIHYAGAMFYKIAVFFFNVIPYFALRIVG